MNHKFRIPFFSLFLLLSAFTVCVTAATPATYEVGTWENFCQGAVSHGFDDNMNTNPTAVEQTIFDDKKFHITLHVQTGSCSWANCLASFKKGHEISSHTVSHNSAASELLPSQQAIKKNVPGEMAVTIAYPNCNVPGSDAEVLKYYIAGRNCDGKTNSTSPTNFGEISAKMFGTCSGCPNDANGLNAFADQAVTQKGWSVYCHHGIGSQTHSWATTNLNAMKSHLEYLDKNRDKIWCETFGNVARYIRERDAKPTITQKSSTETSFTLTVTDNLADSIFNYPLSIRCPLPTGWTASFVTQGGKIMADTIVTVSSKQYIQFKAVPDGGDVVISKDPVAVIRSASAFEVACPVTRKRATLIIDTRQFNGSAMTVTLFDLAGKTLAHYTLGRSDTRIALPADKIDQSAFIAKITGGNKTYIGTFMPQ
jgi:hypothetical protein